MISNTILLFLGGLGGSEVFLILAVLVLFFGAKKIPEIARGLGKGVREFKDATNSIQTELSRESEPVVRTPTTPVSAPMHTSPESTL